MRFLVESTIRKDYCNHSKKEIINAKTKRDAAKKWIIKNAMKLIDNDDLFEVKIHDASLEINEI